MRKSLLIISLILTALSSCNRVKDGDHTLDIYVTSDVHGCYFSKYYLDDSVKPNSLSKVSAIVRKARETDSDIILIDNGDNLQGDNGAFYFNFVDTSSTHIFARMADYMKYDAIVLGNHDIEAGHPVYDRLKEQHTMPLLAANAVSTEGWNAGRPYFDEYTILQKNGLKVAIIGMTNPKVTNWITESLYEGIEFLNCDDMAQALVNRVRSKEHPDFVIVSVHCGSGEEDVESIENDALFLAKHLDGVDLVIGGHDHRPRTGTYSDKEVPTGYVDPGARCNYLGHATFTLTYKNGKRTGYCHDVELIPLADLAPDPEFDAAFEEDYNKVKEFTLRKICKVSAPFALSDALDGPSAYMNLLYDVQLAVSGADITFAAPLTSSGVINAGDLVYNDLTRIYPFENKLFVISLTGEQIRNYLEYSYDRWIRREGPAYCYDSAGGIKYKVYKKRPMGTRVEIESMLDGTPFDPGKSYKVAITSYRAMGGDGMLGTGAGLDVSNPDSYIVERYPEIKDLLYDYLEKVGTLDPKVNDNWKFIE